MHLGVVAEAAAQGDQAAQTQAHETESGAGFRSAGGGESPEEVMV